MDHRGPEGALQGGPRHLRLVENPALIIGGGGIGRALAAALSARGAEVRLLTRPALDITDEASIAAEAAKLASTLRLVIVATGTLHGPTLRPERTYRTLDPAMLLEAYRVNTVGPALVAKHFLPRLAPSGRAVFAALSARVGSIGDNRTGGWHAYRASKAALNMILRNLALELARTRPEQICVGLHPGTVATALSAPFQSGVPAAQLFTPDQSANALLDVIAGLTPRHSGQVFAWDGSPIPP